MPQDDIFLQAECCINSSRLGHIVLLSEDSQGVKFPPSHWSSRLGLKAPSMFVMMSFPLAQPDALLLQFKALSFGLCFCLSAPITGSALACIFGCQAPRMGSPPQRLTEQWWCSTRVSWGEQGSKAEPVSHGTIQKGRLPFHPWTLHPRVRPEEEQGFSYYFLTLGFS